MPPRSHRPLTQPGKSLDSPDDLAQAKDSAILNLLQTAYQRYERQANRWLAQYRTRGGQVYCGAGCFACCDMPIRVSLAEALLVASALSPEQTEAVARHARAVQQNAQQAQDEDDYVETHRRDISFCPLLDRSSGQCSQYAVRPTRCRDTFSAFPARFCAQGSWEALSQRERQAYARQVARTPGTDGEVHYLAPLEHLSEPIWTTVGRAMRQRWGLEVWGDFWTLTTLARSESFMAAVRRGDQPAALAQARRLQLSHPVTLEIL